MCPNIIEYGELCGPFTTGLYRLWRVSVKLLKKIDWKILRSSYRCKKGNTDQIHHVLHYLEKEIYPIV